MAFDVNIAPAPRITPPRWLWGGPSPRRADGTPIINKQHDTNRWINFLLRYLWAAYLPTSLQIGLYICISLSYLPTIQYLPSFPVKLPLPEHPQQIRGPPFCYPCPGVISIEKVPWSARSIEDVMWLLFFLSHTVNRKSSDNIRRIWIVIPPLEVLDRVGYFGNGYFSRFCLVFKQLTYKKRINRYTSESYGLFGWIEEVYNNYSLRGLVIVM